MRIPVLTRKTLGNILRGEKIPSLHITTKINLIKVYNKIKNCVLNKKMEHKIFEELDLTYS